MSSARLPPPHPLQGDSAPMCSFWGDKGCILKWGGPFPYRSQRGSCIVLWHPQHIALCRSHLYTAEPQARSGEGEGWEPERVDRAPHALCAPWPDSVARETPPRPLARSASCVLPPRFL